MAIETDADRVGLLADFGTDGEYTLAAGKCVTITGILDKEFVEVLEGMGRPVASQRHVFEVRTIDVTGAAGGDDLVIGDTTYKVREVEPDGTGFTQLILEVQ